MAAASRSFDDELVGLFLLSQDAFCTAGFDGYLKRANPAFSRSLGYTDEQLLAVPFLQHIHPEDRGSVEALLGELSAGNPVVGFECRHICADGSIRWLEWSTSSRPEAGLVYGVGRDITERRIANDELSALRHIATLAAEGVAPADLFAVVAEEVARVVGVPFVTVARYALDNTLTVCATFPKEITVLPVGTRLSLDGTTLSALVRDSSGAVRIDDYSQVHGEIAVAARGAGVRSTVGVPLVVAGRQWGAMSCWTTAPEPLPDDTAVRLARFNELLATAIANAESREAVARLADEQAALRRVATLVARSTPPLEVFAAVAEEMARCLGTTDAEVFRYDPDGTAVVVAAYRPPGARRMTVGERLTLEGDSVSARVLHTGLPARMDSYENVEGAIAARTRELGPRSRVGAPIVVDEHVWGVALVGASQPEQLASDIEARIAEFADLVATALANTATRSQLHASQDELRMLAEQQAALRRVATLVARGTSPDDLFAVVAEEVTRVVDVPLAIVVRYDSDGIATDCASFPPAPEISTVGKRWSLGGTNVRSMVRETSAPARIDDYSQLDGELADHARRVGYNSSVGVPIIVAGHLWGAMIVSTIDPLPEDTAERLARFTELLATAIANAESREALARLAEQQASLRRVATLVARGVEPSEVFEAVTDEMRQRMDAIRAGLWRFETSDELTLVAGASADPASLSKWPVGTRTPIEGNTLASTVQRTGRPARMDDYDNVTGSIADRVRNVGVRAAVGVPIIVDGSLWGMAAVGSITPGPLPPDTEARMADFVDLVTTSIANAATRDELLASRARIVAAADDARRRIERDLHDGAQQRLVALGLELRAAEAYVPAELQPLKEQIAGLVTTVAGVSAEVQEISRGLHPAILSRGGLAPALKTLARRCAVPVELDVHVDQRLPDPVEVGAYYVVAEALTNAAKHARASVVEVCAHATSTLLALVIRDDGVGGAARGKGSGLTGLVDRVEALGGKMTIQSQPGSGTSLLVNIPIGSD
jgi:PAS domain S-box-containing protein